MNRRHLLAGRTALGRLIGLIARTKKLPRTPSVAEVFDRRFLPPESERIRSLARG